MSDRGGERRRRGDDAATFRSNETNGEYQDIVRRAALIIERAWCSYRDKQMFRLLKHSLCAAEHSLSKDILRKVVPKESKLLDDPIFKVKIKFRFAGEEFPPYIVFKIYTKTHNNQQAKYINGRSVITSSPTAAQEACSQMGNRKYFNLIILDELQQHPDGRVADPDSVVSLRDYMQYSSNLDNMPAYLGGRSNSWRRLNLEDLPKYTVFYDVMNYALNKKMSNHLFKQLPVLLQQPNSVDIQMAQMKVISKIDTSIIENNLISYSSTLNSSTYKSLASQVSSRRSKKTMDKVSRMKKAYTMSMARSETVTSLDNGQNSQHALDDSFKIPDELNDDFEAEVKNLYTWTKNLTLSDEFLNTPRASQH